MHANGAADLSHDFSGFSARAVASQARASAYVLSAVPVFAASALLLINPRYILTLFSDPRGNIVLAMAISALALGLATMKAIIRRSLS